MIQYFLALQLIRLVFSQDFCDITPNETEYSAFNLGDKVIIRTLSHYKSKWITWNFDYSSGKLLKLSPNSTDLVIQNCMHFKRNNKILI